MVTARRRVRTALAACVALSLVALVALAELLVSQLGDQVIAHLGDTGSPLGVQAAQIRAQVRAAEVMLWLGAAAVGALAIALCWSALQLTVLRRLESAARMLAAGDDAPLLASAGDEIDRLTAALTAYRRQLQDERTDRGDQMQALGVLRGAADAIAAQLQQSDRLALVGRVAMGMAHEIGGPLAIVVGFLDRLQALQQAEAPLDQRLRCIDQARHAADRIHALLSDMAQPGLPQPRDVDRPCDAAAVAVRVIGQCEQHPRARQLQLELQAAASQHPCDASASHLEQVLMNLVINAADAVHGTGMVRIGVQRDGDWQVIDVDDDGPGIPEADRERIFDEFYSTKGGASAPGEASRRSGWGLGLAVSRRIIGRYGGSLVASQAPQRGARMTVRLPVPGGLRNASRQSGVRAI